MFDQLDLGGAFDPRKLREHWLARLTEYTELYMRSALFLSCLRYGWAFHTARLLRAEKSSAHATGTTATMHHKQKNVR